MRFLDLVEKDDASSLSDLKTDEQGEDGAGGKVGAVHNARGRFARSSRRNLPFHPSDGASPAACLRCGEVCAHVVSGCRLLLLQPVIHQFRISLRISATEFAL